MTQAVLVRGTVHSAECMGDARWECHWDPGEWVTVDPVYARMSAHTAATGHTEYKIHTEKFVRAWQ